MIDVSSSQVISAAWTDILHGFVQSTHGELLVMSPWITTAAARLISNGLAAVGPVKLRVLARVDESDFLSGASHLEAFKRETYPSTAQVEFRALPMLHGKMLLADRKRVVIGSANMTDGGLYRNHEICLLFDSPGIGEECAEAFFKYWDMATPLPVDYLVNIEAVLDESRPDSEDEESRGTAPGGVLTPRPGRRTQAFKYVSPQHAAEARRHLADVLALGPPEDMPTEDARSALSWLTGTLRSLSREARLSKPVVLHLACLMYHPDISVRATAIDRAGRNGVWPVIPRLLALAGDSGEPPPVRSAAAFSLGLLGSQEAFPTLAALSSKAGDVGRWARRGCFLLLAAIHEDDQIWYLNEIQVQDPVYVIDLARRCQMASGSSPARMTKALLIEKCGTGVWMESDVEALVCVMMLTARLLATPKRRPELGTVIRIAAEVLRVAPGDLRHGPLSPSLLRSLASSGLSDPGLSMLLGPIWDKFKSDESSQQEVLSVARFLPVLKILESLQSDMPDAAVHK